MNAHLSLISCIGVLSFRPISWFCQIERVNVYSVSVKWSRLAGGETKYKHTASVRAEIDCASIRHSGEIVDMTLVNGRTNNAERQGRLVLQNRYRRWRLRPDGSTLWQPLARKVLSLAQTSSVCPKTHCRRPRESHNS